MKYLIAILFPFIPFFYIKKPVSGYVCFVLQVFVLLAASLYPNIAILFVLWFLLDLWAFFEISDFNNKNSTNIAITNSLHKLEKITHSTFDQDTKDDFDKPINLRDRNKNKDISETNSNYSDLDFNSPTMPYNDYRKTYNSKPVNNKSHALDDDLQRENSFVDSSDGSNDYQEDYRNFKQTPNTERRRVIPVKENQNINDNDNLENSRRSSTLDRYDRFFENEQPYTDLDNRDTYDNPNVRSRDYREYQPVLKDNNYNSNHPAIIRSKNELYDKYLTPTNSRQTIPDYERYDRSPKNHFINENTNNNTNTSDMDYYDSTSKPKYSISKRRSAQNNNPVSQTLTPERRSTFRPRRRRV